MKTRSRMWPVLLGALCFGAAMAVIKGQDVGARDAFGNTSAPWVLVAFLAGTRCTRLWAAALLGLAATMVAFFGFYLTEAAVLDLGRHPWWVDVKLTLGSGHVYELWGLVSGTAYGALGGLWATRRLAAAAAAVGLAFACEPLIVFALVRAGVWGGGGLFDYTWLWVGEIAVGAGAIALVLRRRRPA
jgi:hypothetical protein